MSKPTVAIVGRPNTGKSTLFNRILGGRRAIVSDRPGTTRDRHFGDAEWNGRHFWLVDTGGLVPDSNDSMDRAIRTQVEFALAEADLVLFVVDGAEGINPVDRAIADRLRHAGRPVVLAVNKLDDLERSTAHYDFYQLGFGDPYGVSAAIGKGSCSMRSWSGSLPQTMPSRSPRSRWRWWGARMRGNPLSSTGSSGKSGMWSPPRPVPRGTRSIHPCATVGSCSSSLTPQGYAGELK